MSRRQIGLFRQGLIAFDVAVTLVAFVLTFYLRQYVALAMHGVGIPWGLSELSLPVVTDARSYEQLLVAVMPIWAFALYSAGTTDFRLSYRQQAMRYARAIAIGLALIVTFSFLAKLHFVARSFVVLFGAMNF